MANKKEYYAANRERLKQKMREYYQKTGKARYIRTRDERIAYTRKRWRENPSVRERHYERRRERMKTSEVARLKSKAYRKITLLNNRKLVLERYGSFCQCCGESQNEFLAIDHVNGCGAELRKLQGGGSSFYSWLKRHGLPDGYQVLCHNCNMAKALHGMCPHKKEKAR